MFGDTPVAPDTGSISTAGCRLGIGAGTHVPIGVGVGVGVAPGFGVTIGVGVAVAVGVGTGPGVGVELALPVGVGFGTAVGTGVGIGVEPGLGVVVAVGDGTGVGVGAGVGNAKLTVTGIRAIASCESISPTNTCCVRLPPGGAAAADFTVNVMDFPKKPPTTAMFGVTVTTFELLDAAKSKTGVFDETVSVAICAGPSERDVGVTVSAGAARRRPRATSNASARLTPCGFATDETAGIEPLETLGGCAPPPQATRVATKAMAPTANERFIVYSQRTERQAGLLRILPSPLY